MRKTIITAGLLFGIVAAHGQAKPYQPDWSNKIALPQLTVSQLYKFTTVVQSGVEGITKSDKLTGAQITAIITDYNAVSDSIRATLIRHIEADQKRYAADTLKAWQEKKGVKK